MRSSALNAFDLYDSPAWQTILLTVYNLSYTVALWALLCRSEKAKVALRGARLLQQLQQAEKALAARAMEPAAPAPPGARDDLNAALKNLDAVGWLLGLDGMQLRFGAAGP